MPLKHSSFYTEKTYINPSLFYKKLFLLFFPFFDGKICAVLISVSSLWTIGLIKKNIIATVKCTVLNCIRVSEPENVILSRINLFLIELQSLERIL